MHLPTFILFLSSFILHPSSSLHATPITSLDKLSSELATHLHSPATLILTIHSQADLPEAQRLLTLAASQDQPTLVLIALPESPIDSLAIRSAAKRFFKSDFSRPLTYFIKAADHPYPEFKTLLLSPTEPHPFFASETYPQELPAR